MQEPKSRWRRPFLIIAVAILLMVPIFLWCLSSGDRAHLCGENWAISTRNICKIKIGQTTKQIIKGIFGEPGNIRQGTSREIWSYSRGGQYFRLWFMIDAQTIRLVVAFDENGIVADLDYTVTEQRVFKRDVIRNLTNELDCVNIALQ